MAWVTLGLGSSLDCENQIKACLDELLLNFSDLSLSFVFESVPVGFEGANFLNMVVGFETEVPVDSVLRRLKEIEDKFGVDRNQPRFSPREIDIDLLTYHDYVGTVAGKKLPRPAITENAYTLWPLSQVSSNRKHPVLKKSYQMLWKGFFDEKRDDVHRQLWPIDFEWHGRKISHK